MDNCAAHKTPEVRTWLEENPRSVVHFTPSHASFGSVKDLDAKIRDFIDGWNNRPHPFAWTKTADEVLRMANPNKTSETNH